MTEQHIVALGGGGFSMEQSTLLDEYVLGVARNKRPKICFVPTASGDNENYIVRFYRRFNTLPCSPRHLELFRRSVTDLAAFALEQDIIYVGGGNTANMLAVWRLHGFDDALWKALSAGTVLAGISAGAVCWFQSAVTESFGPELTSVDGLGFLPGSNCPHYDGEAARRPAYHRLVQSGMQGGLAADDGVALHFKDGALNRIVSSRPSAKAYRVQLTDEGVSETALETEFLGEYCRADA